MLEISKKSNLLEQGTYKYSLQDIKGTESLQGHVQLRRSAKSCIQPETRADEYAGRYLDYGYFVQRRPAVHGALHGETDRGFI